MRAAIYIRTATQYQDGIIAQKEACIRRAREIGATEIIEFIDEGFSGFSIDRPGLQDLRGGVANNTIDVVIIYNLARLARNTEDLLLLIAEFEQEGVQTLSGQFRREMMPNLQKPEIR